MENNQPRPKNYLVESILVTLFCCMPLGIVSIISASKVNSAYDAGNYEEAQKASDDAKKWMKYGLIGSAIFYVLYFVFLFAMGGLAMLTGDGGY